MRAETVEGTFAELRGRFARACIATANLDARLIVQHSLKISHADFIARPGLPVSPGRRKEIMALAARREAGEPIARLFGEREFHGLAFRLTRHAFDPRPDTEILVEAALEAARSRFGERKHLRILELGTGSGAIVISLLVRLAHATATAVDICPYAIAVAQQNAALHQVHARVSFNTASWFDGLCGTFDMIVANPPYLRSDDIAGLAREVAGHDPRLALDGGSDGLGAYRQIGQRACEFLAGEGLLLLEIGCGQRNAVSEILRAHGYRSPDDMPETQRDLGGIERVLIFDLPKTGLHKQQGRGRSISAA